MAGNWHSRAPKAPEEPAVARKPQALAEEMERVHAQMTAEFRYVDNADRNLDQLRARHSLMDEWMRAHDEMLFSIRKRLDEALHLMEDAEKRERCLSERLGQLCQEASRISHKSR